MVSTVAAAVTLFYLSAIPVHIAFRISIGADSRFSVGISLFEPHFALRHTVRPNLKARRLKNEHPLDKLKSALSALKRLKPECIRLGGVFGSDSAALTALVCGGANALGCSLPGAARNRVKISIQPDFSSDRLRMELTGMISVRAGHIMTAALFGALQYGSRRLKQWTGTLLKAL